MTDLITGVFGVAVVLFILYSIQEPPAPPLENETYQGKARYIVDGDTLYIRGHKPAIRLWGVDAPEKNESGHIAATNMLKQLAEGKKIQCKKIETDRYGRTVARCFLSNGQEINAAMIASGTASEYKRFTKGFYSGD